MNGYQAMMDDCSAGMRLSLEGHNAYGGNNGDGGGPLFFDHRWRSADFI